MSRAKSVLASAAIIVALGRFASGCAADDCDKNPKLGCGPYASGTTASSSSSGQGGGGSGGGIATGCDPATEKTPVADSCGVFVSSSKGDDATADGTKQKPFKTIAKAAASGKKALYLCGEVFAEAADLAAGVSLYGGLNCKSDWSYDAKSKATIQAKNAIALRITGAGASTVQDVAAVADDATMPGGSSIAALVDAATVSFTRVELRAGKGADGAIGETPMGTGADGKKGPDGKTGCTGSGTVDPDKIVPLNDCGNGENSTGGLGGNGKVGDGGTGDNGDATPTVSNANGGLGQPAIGGNCKQGADGLKGANGGFGDGAAGLGTLAAAGYTGVAGANGKSAGKPGQGGGGGGGASGKVACAIATNSGPSGAGGGSGGCGGKPGKGGVAGGSSIALVSLAAKVTLTASTVTTADGGAGGKGSNGQTGGSGFGGGQGGTGDKNNACPGGKGGTGGQGGAGGGGLGGHSIAIAFTGDEPKHDDKDVPLTVGKAGAGGVGGDGGMNNQGGKGADGVAAKTKTFDAK